jgi:hypothetical protein
MTAELRLAKLELSSSGVAYQPPKLRLRNLGGAIFLVAIEDYRSTDAEIHQDAKAFLYPTTADWQDHFDWAVALADGMNPEWLRDALDRCRSEWDKQRAARLGRPSRRQLIAKRKANELKTRMERCEATAVVRSGRVAV